MAAVTPGASTPTFPAWEAQLTAQRGTLNGILADARSAGAPVDALRSAMRELGPPVESLLGVLSPSAGDVMCRVLTELVGDLVVRKAWHERSAERWAVRSLLPRLPRAMDRSARTTVEVVVHGAGRIGRETDLGAWGVRLAAADAHLSDDAALRAGAAVAAWRSGLVRVRRSALAAVAAFDPVARDDGSSTEALRALLGLPDADGSSGSTSTGGAGDSPWTALAANRAEPFSWPGASERGTVATYGGYRAFGGPWTGVPVVLGAVDAPTPTWRVLADDIAWVVVADVHGHAVLREPPGVAPAPAPAPSLARPSALAREVSTLVAWEDEITGAVPAAGTEGSPVRPVLVSRATSCRLDLVLVPTARDTASAAPTGAPGGGVLS